MIKNGKGEGNSLGERMYELVVGLCNEQLWGRG